MEGRRRKRTRTILRGRVYGDRARDEPRLLRRREAACGAEAEGGADGLAREGAEAGLAEVAITAGCFGSIAHTSSRSECPVGVTTAILGAFPRLASVAADEN
jgi:hypothetical protein